MKTWEHLGTWRYHAGMSADAVHTPGAGLAWAREVLGDRVPDLSDEDEHRVDELIASLEKVAKLSTVRVEDSAASD